MVNLQVGLDLGVDPGISERGETDLCAEVVDVERLLHLEAARSLHLGQMGADHHVAEVADVQGRVGVGGGVLDDDALAARRFGVPELVALGGDRADHETEHARAVDEEVEVRADALHLCDEALGLVDVCLETLDELRDVRDGVHLALGGERGPLHGEVRLLEVPGPSHAGQIVRVGLFRLDKHLDLGVEPLHELVEDILACGEVLVRHLRRHTV
mmetsp:Transcript_4470/g.18344  ORF Transcript_4470/g.18344 Transcript_4470/m.18344 type:complete len:214 (+) Transcript_4470:1597-2238(+)